MREVQADLIYQELLQAIQKAATHLPGDVLQALQEARSSEEKESAREILDQLLKNAELARETGLPLCQDTGLGVFFVRLGQECRIQGTDLVDTLNRAMVDAYEQAYLRKSVCHPLSRQNTGDNSPALIHFDLVPGQELGIRFMAKGGGSENMSRCTMLTPAQGWTGIKEFVLQRVAQAGPNPCPPTIVGVGIGGSFDQAPALAKEALFQPLDQPNPDPELEKMEQELLEEINQLGIGPMGLGGKTTSLGVRIRMSPCHIASLPLAVNIQCHSSRHVEVVF
ncbi:MAG: fumarate hydratase [Desulfohalobiaceae bacterium]